MKKILVLFSILVYVFSAQGWASPRDDKKKFAENNGVGIVYSLPRTGIQILVTATCEKVFRGPYYQFAEKYLNMKNAATSDYENWKISSIVLNAFGEADPSQSFSVSGYNVGLVNLTPEGVLGGINQPVTEVAKAISSSDNLIIDPIPRIIFPEMLVNDFYRQENDSGKSKKAMPMTLDERAKYTAHELARLKKRMEKMLTGAYEKLLPDGEAFHVMIEDGHKLENEYVSMFMGKSYHFTRQYTFTVVPTSDGKEIVFRFSPDKGVVAKNDPNGTPAFIEYQPDEVPALNKQKQLSAEPQQQSAVANDLFYRNPVNTTVKISDGTSTLATARIPIAQFGPVLPIPAQLLDGSYSIQLNTTTGTIKSIVKKKLEEK